MRTVRTICIAGALLATATMAAPGSSAQGPPTSTSSAPASSAVAAAAASTGNPHGERSILGRYKHLVVIYQENHSFDNMYGNWGKVGGQWVEGRANATEARTIQVDQNEKAYRCLKQDSVNLTSPPLAKSCTDSAHKITSAFKNKPFRIDDYIKPTDTTCPPPGASAPHGVKKGHGDPGGCTRDLVHRFYQEKYQINGGRQNRYVTGSDAIGLSMGYYDTTQMPIYKYLHSKNAPHYVVADRFFQGANGGSFFNHQWLIAGRAPYVNQHGAVPKPKHRPVSTILDANGMPTAYPLYKPTGSVVDGELTVKCANPADLQNYQQACGNFAVNTVQPSSQPYSAKGPFMPLIDDAKYPNIGDRMTGKAVSWAWYSGGWDAAAAGHPGPLFQYHHQPFNYFADYAPGKPGRHHLQDETAFFDAAQIGNLPTVSFVKPYGAENEHPGYASANSGSQHLVDLVKAVATGPQAKDTLVLITYDEFGGQWDHVPPPGKGSPTRGAYDAFGPGTRIPALLLSAGMSRSGVDHRVYDTTSILATLEHSFGLATVGIRDTKVHDLQNAIRIGR